MLTRAWVRWVLTHGIPRTYLRVAAHRGKPLARAEGAIALRALFDRYPNLRLDGPPVPHPLRNLHAYRSMPATLVADQE
ncbi:hypothetical protein ABIA39_006302 [Nocardia sp. GAS34]